MNRQDQVALCQALHSAKGLQGPHLQACVASQHRQSRSVLKAMYRCHMLQVSSLRATALRLCQRITAEAPCQPLAPHKWPSSSSSRYGATHESRGLYPTYPRLWGSMLCTRRTTSPIC